MGIQIKYFCEIQVFKIGNEIIYQIVLKHSYPQNFGHMAIFK